jgi:hypothetical protein
VIPEHVLQITAGIGTVYRIERRYVGESVSELAVVVVDGTALDDFDTPGREVFRAPEEGTAIEWAYVSGIVAAAVATEIEAETSDPHGGRAAGFTPGPARPRNGA